MLNLRGLSEIINATYIGGYRAILIDGTNKFAFGLIRFQELISFNHILPSKDLLNEDLESSIFKLRKKAFQLVPQSRNFP
jgi:hypothetical protein